MARQAHDSIDQSVPTSADPTQPGAPENGCDEHPRISAAGRDDPDHADYLPRALRHVPLTQQAAVALVGEGRACWHGLDADELAALLWFSWVDFRFPAIAEVEPDSLLELYRYFEEVANVDTRIAKLADFAVECVEKPGFSITLSAFHLFDHDIEVGARAAEQLASLWSARPGLIADDLSGVEAFCAKAFERPDPRVHASAIAGLLRLGDPRLRPFWEGRQLNLPYEIARELLRHLSDLRTTESVACLLDWLTDPDCDEDFFGHVAGTLYALSDPGDARPVVEHRRLLPGPAYRIRAREAAGLPAVEVTGSWHVREYGARMHERFHEALHAERQPPFVMHRVARAWGIDPGPPWRRPGGPTDEDVVETGAMTAVVAASIEETYRLDLHALPSVVLGKDEDRIAEWGIFDPLGCAVHTLHLVEGAEGHLIVHTHHSPTSADSWVLGFVARPLGEGALSDVLMEAFGTNCRGPWTMGGGSIAYVEVTRRPLPHYLWWKAFFAAHQCGPMGTRFRPPQADPLRDLEDLRENPWAWAARGIYLSGEPEDASGAFPPIAFLGEEGFPRWFRFASDPTHVERMRSAISAGWYLGLDYARLEVTTGDPSAPYRDFLENHERYAEVWENGGVA